MEEPTVREPTDGTRPYDPPRFEVIPLDCEITSYAPDEGEPLF